METIFHEKQEGSLCAQHCLNNLLQGEYFTAVELAAIANSIDEEERRRMAEGGTNNEDYRKFIEQPSGNMDDSGFFSVQVLASALKVWDLELIPFSSQNPVAQAAQTNPYLQKAYICNYREHWFAVRKFGQQWFNLNSLLTYPELISETYLGLFLAQLRQEGYSIFVVVGIFPSCEADKVLSVMPAVQIQKPCLLSQASKKSQQATGRETAQHSSVFGSSQEYQCDDDEDTALQAALQMSLDSSQASEAAQLQAALALSLEAENH